MGGVGGSLSTTRGIPSVRVGLGERKGAGFSGEMGRLRGRPYSGAGLGGPTNHQARKRQQCSGEVAHLSGGTEPSGSWKLRFFLFLEIVM